MGRVSQVLGYFFGFIILIIGIGLIIVTLVQPFLFLGSIPLIGLLLTIFGFIIMYLGHRSRPTKEKKMLKEGYIIKKEIRTAIMSIVKQEI